MEIEVSVPTRVMDPKRSRVLEACRASTAPVKKPVSTTMGRDPRRSHPPAASCRKSKRPAEEIGDRLTAEQNVILNRADSILDEVGGRGEFHAARSAAVELRRFHETIAEQGQWSVARDQRSSGVPQKDGAGAGH